MDLAEKRKQLEALRAARQAKQQLVEQYISGRSSNPNGSPTSSTSLSRSALSLAPPAIAAAGDSVAVTGALASPRSARPPSLRSRSGGGRLSVSSTRGPAVTAKAAAPSAASSPVTSASPTTPAAQRARPTTPSRQTAPSQAQAAPADGGVAPRSIRLVSVNKESTVTHAAVAGFSAASPNACPVVGPLHGSALLPVTSRAAGAPPTEEGLAAYGGWGFLRKCMRVPARDATGAAVTQPVCIFNPSVLLGDVVGSVESSRRRVVLDSTSCLVPYDGAAAGQRLGDAAMMTSPTVWSVCVAAAYGSCESPAVTGGGNASELSMNMRCHGNTDPAGPENRMGASALDPLLMLSTGGTPVGTSQQRARAAARPATGAAAAAAAAARVRASMDCGYPWGSDSAAPSAVPGTTTESALKVAKESPGLVLAWFLVPMPANTILRKKGSFAGTTAAPGSGFVSCVSGDITATPEYVVIVLPLVCDSEVTTLLAHPLQPSTLLGGTRCGRIVQWSIGQAWAQVEPRRLLERALATTGTTTTLLLPPQRPAHSSFPSPQAHQAPVLRMAVHGDASCHHLYSISQEGKVCTWTASQPLHPAASCLSYLGIRPMGCIGVTAQFVERAGTDAMTKVFIGTTSGALLVGTNRDAKSIELQYYGPPRALPTSSTVIRTLDVTATPAYPSGVAAAASTTSFRDSAGTAAPTCSTASPDHPTGAEASAAPEQSGQHRLTATSSQSAATAAVARRVQPAALHPHRGRIVSMALQTATHGLRGRDCVVSAATDGSCVAWFDRSVIPLEGFSSAVTSVCWSPTKQGVLAAGDASGLVTVWAVNTSIITPVVTVSLREAGHRARGNASSDGVLWVVSGASDAGAGAGGGTVGGGTFGFGSDDDEADAVDGEEVGASLGEADVVGSAISSVFFSRDGQWLFASTARGYVHTLHLGVPLA